MDTSFCYTSFHPNTEGIMSVRNDLQKNKCTDRILLSNLAFAESVLRNHPLKGSSKLLVKGEYSYVQIGDSEEKVFTVTLEDKEIHLNLCIHDSQGPKVNKYNIKACHFFGHACQDEITSCFDQAKEAVPADGVHLLHITCNRFSIIYTTEFVNLIKTVTTKCQFKLENITAEGLLERKIWLQKEKSTSHELIECLDHLIKLYLTTPDAPKNNCRFIIHGNKEIVRIFSSGEHCEKEYVLQHEGYSKLSMFPPAWE